MSRPWKTSESDWRANAEYGLYGFSVDDCRPEWDAFLAAHDRQVKAEALREAADMFPGSDSHPSVVWLRVCADAELRGEDL